MGRRMGGQTARRDETRLGRWVGRSVSHGHQLLCRDPAPIASTILYNGCIYGRQLYTTTTTVIVIIMIMGMGGNIKASCRQQRCLVLIFLPVCELPVYLQVCGASSSSSRTIPSSWCQGATSTVSILIANIWAKCYARENIHLTCWLHPNLVVNKINDT